MILEKLKLIKSFGTSLDSAVAEADIAAKEKELGFPLPEALREVYLTFSPEDPIFSTWMNLIPLDELRTIVLEDRDKHGAVLPFFRNDTWLCSALVGSFLWKKLETQVLFYDVDLNDPPVFLSYREPKSKKEAQFFEMLSGNYLSHETEDPLSLWLTAYLGIMQVYSQPSLLILNKRHEWDWAYQKRLSALRQEGKYHPVARLEYHMALADIAYLRLSDQPVLEALSGLQPIPLPHSARVQAYGAQTDEALEEVVQALGVSVCWLRSQTGKRVFQVKPPEPPQERELLSITPVLEFLREFAGITRAGAKEESIQRAEARLEAPLPQPMEEFYRCLPSSFYRSCNTIRPISGLKKAKDGKLNFLEENQAVYHWAAEPGSPFVYRRANHGAGEWAPCGILDGFLAAEFLWAVACAEDSELELWEFPDFAPEMLEPGGLFDTHIQSIAGISQQIAVGNERTVYQSVDGGSVLLHDRSEQILFVLSKDEAAVNQLLAALGLPTEPMDA